MNINSDSFSDEELGRSNVMNVNAELESVAQSSAVSQDFDAESHSLDTGVIEVASDSESGAEEEVESIYQNSNNIDNVTRGRFSQDNEGEEEKREDFKNRAGNNIAPKSNFADALLCHETTLAETLTISSSSSVEIVDQKETPISAKKKSSISKKRKTKSTVTSSEKSSSKKKRRTTKGSTPKALSSNNTYAAGSSSTAAKSQLTLPFRAIKRIMKIDNEIGTVQNEAAILTTFATELFLKKFSQESHALAKQKSRNTVRYEDLAEARVENSSFSFLDVMIP